MMKNIVKMAAVVKEEEHCNNYASIQFSTITEEVIDLLDRGTRVIVGIAVRLDTG